MVGLGTVILLFFILTETISVPATRTALRSGLPVKSSKQKSKNPMVVIIDPYKHYTEFLNEIRSDKMEKKEEEDDVLDPKEDAKSLFYQFLRTSPEGESNPDIENHKNFLRSALRSRCHKVSSCVQNCPSKKPSCPGSCQEVFDAMNLCEPPKKKTKTYKVTYEFECEDEDECGGQNGKTMPPRWRMRH